MQKIIVINGWSANACLWQEAKQGLQVLAADVQIIDLDVFESIDQFEKLLIEASCPNTMIIAWSLGAQIAIQCLLRSTDLSQRIVGLVALQATPCFVEKDDWDCGYSLENFEALYQSCVNKEFVNVKRVFAHLLVQGSENTRADRTLLKQTYVTRELPRQEILLKGLQLLKEIDLRPNLDAVPVPVLWLLGEEDYLVSNELCSHLVNLGQNHVELISGMGHFPCGTYWDRVYDSIQRFVEEQ